MLLLCERHHFEKPAKVSQPRGKSCTFLKTCSFKRTQECSRTLSGQQQDTKTNCVVCLPQFARAQQGCVCAVHNKVHQCTCQCKGCEQIAQKTAHHRANSLIQTGKQTQAHTSIWLCSTLNSVAEPQTGLVLLLLSPVIPQGVLPLVWLLRRVPGPRMPPHPRPQCGLCPHLCHRPPTLLGCLSQAACCIVATAKHLVLRQSLWGSGWRHGVHAGVCEAS